MKRLFLLFLIAATCMANQCGNEPCENAPACDSVELGTLNLSPASASAIPFQGHETVTFVNSQGFRANFQAQGFKNNTDANFQVRSLDNCGICWEFYRLESSSLTFQGSNLNFSFTYNRLKNLPEQPNSAVPDPTTTGDALAFTLGPIRFAGPLTSEPIALNTFTEFRLRDSVTLGPKTYFQVYEVVAPNISAASEILPKGIYYTRKDGLVGYYFTNSELWYRQ